MEIVHDERASPLRRAGALAASEEHPLLVDRYLQDAIEVDVDVVRDGDRWSSAG